MIPQPCTMVNFGQVWLEKTGKYYMVSQQTLWAICRYELDEIWLYCIEISPGLINPERPVALVFSSILTPALSARDRHTFPCSSPRYGTIQSRTGAFSVALFTKEPLQSLLLKLKEETQKGDYTVFSSRIRLPFQSFSADDNSWHWENWFESQIEEI